MKKVIVLLCVLLSLSSVAVAKVEVETQCVFGYLFAVASKASWESGVSVVQVLERRYNKREDRYYLSPVLCTGGTE